MEAETFEPMSLGMILDRMVQFYRRDFFLMLGIVLATQGPLLLLQIPLTQVFQLQEDSTMGEIFLFFGLFLLWLLLWMVVSYPLSQGASTYVVSERYLGGSPTFGEAMGSAFRKILTLINTQISVSLAGFLAFLVAMIPGLLLGLVFYLVGIPMVIGVGLGVFPAMIVVMIVVCGYMVTLPVVIVEGEKTFGAMRRSWELTKGYRMKVFFFFLFILGITLVSLGTVFVMRVLIFGLDLNGKGGILFYDLFSSLITVLLFPVGIIGTVLLYYDFRIRKEGFDLEMLGDAFSEEQEGSGVDFSK